MFGAAMGLYPNRHVIDAAFSVVIDGVQHSVFASGRIPVDRRQTRTGPITVEVVEPMRTLRISVDHPDSGVSADLTFRARTVAVEEPRQTIVDGTSLVMDYTRLTQWGGWEGTFTANGETTEVAPDSLGTRDRSWGVRPVGAPPPGPRRAEPPQLFWLWAPLNFDDRVTHLALFEHADGNRWMESGAFVDVLDSPDAATFDVDEAVTEAGVDYQIDWQPGSRQAERASLWLTPRGGEAERIDLEPLLAFRMRGIGYTHPEWGHGQWKGENEVGHEAVKVDDFDLAEPSSIHVQQLVRATAGDDLGIGVIEQLAFGPHQPTGLTGFTDPPT